MAKFTSLGKLNLIEFKGSVPREVVEATSDTAVNLVLSKVRPLATAHYQNAVAEIGRKLNGLGMAQNVRSSGPRSLSMGTASGDVDKILTVPWKRLDWNRKKDATYQSYESRPPLSLWFWQKRGMESLPGSLSPAYQQKVAGRAVVRVLEYGKAKRNHHKGRINTRISFEFKSLAAPFASMITNAFAQANEKVPLDSRSLSSSRKGLHRARWAEDRTVGRPFIRRMSAHLGVLMRKDVIEKLRNL